MCLSKFIAKRGAGRLIAVFFFTPARRAGRDRERRNGAEEEVFEHCPDTSPLGGKFAKNVMKDAAIAVIFHLVLSIDTAKCGESEA